MMAAYQLVLAALICAAGLPPVYAQAKREFISDRGAVGLRGRDMQLPFLAAHSVATSVLGIAAEQGRDSRHEEDPGRLRLIGIQSIPGRPAVPGAVLLLVGSKVAVARWKPVSGNAAWQGALC